MKISNPLNQQILQQLNVLDFETIDSEKFIRYTPYAYKNSQWQEMDEVHRMYEHAIIHKNTGLRISYLSTESYDGESVEYTVINCFVITHQNQRYDVTGIDLDKRTFETTEGIIPFLAVRKNLSGLD